MPMVALRMAAMISSAVRLSGSSKYFSIKASSCSATASINRPRYSSTVSAKSAGIGTSSQVIPLSSSFHTNALLVIKSTTPLKSSSAPIGTCNGTGRAPSMSLIMPTTLKKSAPERSILLMNPMRGTLYLSARPQLVSDCGSTPDTAQNNATAPSNTRKERSTSTVKSTWPGVSMMLIRYCSSWNFQKHVVAAEVIVIPRSCSCSIQSMVAAPSCTSPIL